ncbi:MAG: aryl-sulfate sulfotransferase [Alphaproteobacteria bacterium]|nr:aryl-sulfate sulfotransferase [Alphaproteobacteria bacterium]
MPGVIASQTKKRSVVVAGHRTSVSLETVFWDRLRDIASDRSLSVNELVTDIDRQRPGSLSSAIRVFVLRELRGYGATRTPRPRSRASRPSSIPSTGSRRNWHARCR